MAYLSRNSRRLLILCVFLDFCALDVSNVFVGFSWGPNWRYLCCFPRYHFLRFPSLSRPPPLFHLLLPAFIASDIQCHHDVNSDSYNLFSVVNVTSAIAYFVPIGNFHVGVFSLSRVTGKNSERIHKISFTAAQSVMHGDATMLQIGAIAIIQTLS
jgi:hypothetical protein